VAVVALPAASQAVLPTMMAQKRGAIVSLASMAGKVGSRTNLPYNASKAAVISTTKSLALAHATDGIRVNCVCPGFVETDMWALLAREQGPYWVLHLRISRSNVPPGYRSDVWSSQRTSPK
jgi:NAD(P)-dependent dehydrogenase (short-subunit alcohol dehydrogenase family)